MIPVDRVRQQFLRIGHLRYDCVLRHRIPHSGAVLRELEIPLQLAHGHNTSVLRPILCGLAVVTILLTACAVPLGGLTPPAQPLEPLGPPSTPTLSPRLLTPVATPAKTQGSSYATAELGLPRLQPTCEATPQWGLGDVWANEEVRTRLGCPRADQAGVAGAKLEFQNGVMLSRPGEGLIYVLFEGGPDGKWGAFADVFDPSEPSTDPSIVDPTPSVGSQALLTQPSGRFGKLWRMNPSVRSELGWALVAPGHGEAAAGIPFQGAAQDFEHGVLFWDTVVCFVLRTDDMSWTAY